MTEQRNNTYAEDGLCCLRCGALNKDWEEIQCPTCGAEGGWDPVMCAECGHVNSWRENGIPGWECVRCGRNLSRKYDWEPPDPPGPGDFMWRDGQLVQIPDPWCQQCERTNEFGTVTCDSCGAALEVPTSKLGQ